MIFKEWDEVQQQQWQDWLKERPPVIQKMAIKYPPNELFQYKEWRVYIQSYNEDGTVTIGISGQYNYLMFERAVFGVNPENLTPCALPDSDEKLGVVLTRQEDIDKYLDYVQWCTYNNHDNKNIIH
jgi:hypothetical protein